MSCPEQALEQALRRADLEAWIDRERRRPRRMGSTIDTPSLMDGVRGRIRHMIVLDASAPVDVLLDQQDADWVLGQMESHGVLAPAHQPAEVLTAIARLTRAGRLAQDAASETLAAAMSLPQQLVAPGAAQVQKAFSLGERIRVLDALYVLLAQESAAPLLTTDRRLVSAGPPCEVLYPDGGQLNRS